MSSDESGGTAPGSVGSVFLRMSPAMRWPRSVAAPGVRRPAAARPASAPGIAPRTRAAASSWVPRNFSPANPLAAPAPTAVPASRAKVVPMPAAFGALNAVRTAPVARLVPGICPANSPTVPTTRAVGVLPSYLICGSALSATVSTSFWPVGNGIPAIRYSMPARSWGVILASIGLMAASYACLAVPSGDLPRSSDTRFAAHAA